jgi:hypothetical protein
VALARGPVVYCIGKDNNASLLKKYPDLLEKIPDLDELTFDSSSFGEPLLDESIRADGRKVIAKAWPKDAEADVEPVDVVFTEFIDPSGILTYFKIDDLAEAVDDELIVRHNDILQK